MFKLKSKIIIAVILIFGITVFMSCNKDNSDISEVPSDYIVNTEQAENLIGQIMTLNASHNKSSQENYTVKRKKTFYDTKNVPYLHILNLENSKGKAFVIVSGDKREMPILAYSDKNEFNIDTMPYGVVDWLQTEMECIELIRSSKAKQSDFIKEQWEDVTLLHTILPSVDKKIAPPDDEPHEPGDGHVCTPISTIVKGPLLETTWGQGCVYNEQCESGCSTNCSHMLTGCTATAVAQIMRYYEHPNTYDWDSLLNIYEDDNFNSSGAYEIARLMSDVGNSLDMNYDCSLSLAYTRKIDNALEDDYNYNNGGIYDDYINQVQTVKSNIDNNQPVIFYGCREIHMGGLWYTGCHTWVCDGYKKYYNCCYGWLYYRMNWGWNGAFNGWYSISSWAPGTKNYRYNQKVVVNIHP